MKGIRHTRTYIAALFIFAAVTIFILCYIGDIRNEYREAYDVPVLKKENIAGTDVDKLMIVAHPDDELLWGGGHLMDGNYLVVSVTRGYDKVRSAEFEKVVTESGNEPLILFYPDKVAGRRDDWQKVRQGIMNDLKTVMEYKDWELIVTHNEDGEYGHQHHKLVHQFVTDIYEDNEINSDLYYFGKYYKKSELNDSENDLKKLDDERLAFKERLAPYYASQEKTVNKLWHMAEYEMWQKYIPGSGNDI